MAEHLNRSKVTASTIVPLNKIHDRKSFDCGKPPLNDFLVNRALNSPLGSTYVLVSDPESSEIIAYLTLAPDIISILNNQSTKSLAGVIKLEYLAVDLKYKSTGIGTDLLIFIMREVAAYSNISSVRLLAIEPLDKEAERWFVGRNFGFEVVYIPDRCLAISIDTILNMDMSDEP